MDNLQSCFYLGLHQCITGYIGSCFINWFFHRGPGFPLVAIYFILTFNLTLSGILIVLTQLHYSLWKISQYLLVITHKNWYFLFVFSISEAYITKLQLHLQINIKYVASAHNGCMYRGGQNNKGNNIPQGLQM